MKTTTMTIPEFLNHNRYDEDEIIKEIRKNKKLERIVAVTLGGLMYCQSVMASTDTGKIDKAGITILTICRQIGYWACIIMCCIEIIRSLMQGDTKGISKIISKYVLGFGALYLLPWIFDIIKTIFS